MKSEDKLKLLVRFLEEQGIAVKSDRGNFKGGLVRYHDDLYFYLNRRLDTDAKINLILKEVHGLEISPQEINEEVKTLLSEYTENDSKN